MTTIPEATEETTIGADSSRWTGRFDRFESVSSWFLVAAYVLLYVVVHAVMLVGAAIAVLYLATALSGAAGVVVFLTLGLTTIAAAPVAVRRAFTRVLEVKEGRHESSRGV